MTQSEKASNGLKMMFAFHLSSTCIENMQFKEPLFPLSSASIAQRWITVCFITVLVNIHLCEGAFKGFTAPHVYQYYQESGLRDILLFYMDRHQD